MAAKKKSGSRKPAAKKKAAKKKAAKSRKPRAAARKKVAKKKVAKTAQISPAVTDVDNRIAILRNNLRDLTEQATAYSGASTEELMSDRIAEQEAKLAALLKQRDKLVRS